MTGKERFKKIEDKLQAAGYTGGTPFIDRFQVAKLVSELTGEEIKEKLYNEHAEMCEAIFDCRTRPAEPFYDSKSKLRNFKSWVNYQKRCLIDPFRRWSQRRRNHKAARLAGLE